MLALLAEQPHHGYSIISELSGRSGGLWRPSPGSVYPVLALLKDEGLVTSAETDGRRVFTLSDTGRAYVDEHAEELNDPWSPKDTGHRRRAASLFDGVRSLGSAAREVAHNGTDAQVEQARAALDDTRKALYRILAEDTAKDGASTAGADPKPSDHDDTASA